MFLVELVVQGVRGFRDLVRLRFQSGFNIVVAGNEAGKTASADAVQRLLFPLGEASFASLLSKHSPDASRAALVMCSDDGAYFRIIQDFSKRAVNLSQYNASAKEFALLHKDWNASTQFMTGLMPDISEEDYAKLFIYKREHGYGAQTTASGQPKPAEGARLIKPAAPAPAKPSANQARLAELQEALRKAEEAADAEYRVQAAKLRREEIKKKLDGLEEANGRIEEADSQLAALKGCDTLPENLADLIVEHEQRQSRKMSDADELTQEIEGLNQQLAEIPSMNLLSDKLFLAGLVVGAASIVVGLFLPSLLPADYFPIGVLAALALVAAAWYKESRKGAQRKLIEKEIETLGANLAALEKSFEEGGSAIMACMRATGSSTVAELKEKAENHRHFRSLRGDLLEERQRLFSGVTFESLQAEYGSLQQEIVELEKAAAALAPFAVDAYSLRQDIERLQDSAPTVASSWDFGGEEPESPPVPSFAAGAAKAGDFQAELGIASKIGGIEMETLVPAVEAAAQRNLTAVSGGKYVRIEVGNDGLPVVHAKDDSTMSFLDLSHGTRTLLYFCLRTGLVEALAGKRRLPFILDDPFGSFDPTRQQAACQVLRALGAKTQVILFTSNPALKAAGDAAAELK